MPLEYAGRGVVSKKEEGVTQQFGCPARPLGHSLLLKVSLVVLRCANTSCLFLFNSSRVGMCSWDRTGWISFWAGVGGSAGVDSDRWHFWEWGFGFCFRVREVCMECI